MWISGSGLVSQDDYVSFVIGATEVALWRAFTAESRTYEDPLQSRLFGVFSRLLPVFGGVVFNSSFGANSLEPSSRDRQG